MSNIIIIQAEELKEILSETVKDAFQSYIVPPIKEENKNELLTRIETATLLGVALSTLDLWTKQGKLTKYRINSSVRYKRGEVLDSFKSFQKYKR